MKKFLSIFAMAMLVVFAMTSCNKDDDPTPEPTPEVVEMGFAYGLVVNEAYANCVESVSFTYTIPGTSGEQTEKVEFKKDENYYSAVCEKYTTKTGKFSVKAKLNLKANLDNTETVSLEYGTLKVSGKKGGFSKSVNYTKTAIPAGKLAEFMQTLSERLEAGYSDTL